MEEVGNYRMKESMASWWVNMGDTAVELGDMNMLLRQISELGPRMRNGVEQRLEEEVAINIMLEEEKKERRIESK